MKRSAFAMMFAVTTALLASGAALAQSGDDPAEGTSKKPPRQEQADRQQRELQRLEQLRRAVIRELKLTDEQHLAIREHFKTHTRFVEQYEPEPTEEQDREELRRQRQALRRQIRQARASGDQQAVRALLEQMRSLQTADPLQQATAEFRRLVADELDEDQKAEFRAIVTRVYRKESDTARERAKGIRVMQQALDRLDLTDEQRAAARKLVGDALKRFVKEGDDPDKIGDIEQQLRDGILNVLSQEQGEVFRGTVRRLQEEPDVSRRGPFRSPAPKRKSPLMAGGDKPADEKERDK
ncbi:MAG: hypothetical protein JSV19_00945 [Phycisphaerales bacterium]|nr:MAG: hypothetical protein JSV19_00945 [Phycisphaerales bacterium]